MGRQDYETETLIASIQERAVSENPDNGPQGAGFRTDEQAYTLEARNKVQAVAFTQNSRSEVRLMGGDGDQVGALGARTQFVPQQQAYIAAASAVRRLTPRECERLQGFPDDYTAVPYRGKPASDGPRYKALGNSMAVPCMVWLGRRIETAEAISTQAEAA